MAHSRKKGKKCARINGYVAENEHVCNVVYQQIHRRIKFPTTVANALGRATEATEDIHAPEYRQIAKRGFSRHFRPEKQKHRNSLMESSDVLP